MKLFQNNKIFTEYTFEKEAEFEREVVSNSKLFFGNNSVYIDAKKKIETKSLGNTIPDGFLFDLADKVNPEFYIVEAELATHDFFRHIFPQITKFFGFYKNTKSRADLVEKIFTIITNDIELKKDFKKHIGEKEIYKFIKDTIDKSQNILLVIDGDKKELPEIIETYSDTWGKMVKHILIKKFTNGNDSIFTMNPEFENLDFADLELEDTESSTENDYTEEQHFEGSSTDVVEIYKTIKNQLLEFNPSLIFNPQKHYISIKAHRNIAYFKVRKQKIAFVLMNEEGATKNIVKHHFIKSLIPSVQKFYNGACCAIMLEKNENLDEIINLVKTLVKKK